MIVVLRFTYLGAIIEVKLGSTEKQKSKEYQIDYKIYISAKENY